MIFIKVLKTIIQKIKRDNTIWWCNSKYGSQSKQKNNISLIFISQFYFPVPKDKRLNATYNFYDENPKQKRAPTNSIKSTISY